MKFLLGLIALSQIVTSPAHAVGCRGAQVIAGSSAAGAMVAGYRGYRAFVRADDILAANESTIFTGRGNPDAAARNVVADDRVTVDYRLSAEANRQHHIEVLEGRISSEQSNASMYRMQAAQAMLPQTETYTDSNGRLQTRTVGPDYSRALLLNNEADRAEDAARQLQREQDNVRAGRGRVPVYTFDTELARTNERAVAAEITRLSRSGSTVTKITRVPRAAVVKIGRAARNGWILVATAVGLGLVAGEQVISDRISCRREQELGRY